MKFPIRHLTALAFLATGLVSCGVSDERASPVSIEAAGAFCRPTPKGLDVTACYLTLVASGDDRLISVSSPVAGEGQIHEMSMTGGVMRMGELLNGLPLAAGSPVTLKPGAEHIMLMKLQQPLAEGDQVSLTLNFEKAPQLGLRFAVARPPLTGGH